MALEFDGVDQRIDGSDTGLPAGNAARTLGMRIKILAWPTAETVKTVSVYGTANVNQVFAMALEGRTGGDLHKFVFTQQGDQCYSATVFALNTFYCLYLVYLGNQWFNWYLDGSLDATTQLTDVPQNLNTVLNASKIGCNIIDAKYSNIIVDDLRYYNRVLSLAEVKSIHYAQGNDNIVNGLVGRWLMNEKADGQVAAGASFVIDISGNGNHGTPVNEPVYRGASLKLVRPLIFTKIKE